MFVPRSTAATRMFSSLRDAGQEPEQLPHGVPRLANRLELHVEPRRARAARRAETSPSLADEALARSRWTWIRADASAIRAASAPKLGFRPLELAPEPDAAQHDIDEPANDADEENCERDPKGHDCATIVAATRGGAVR